MVPRRDDVRNDAEIEALLREPLLNWPRASPVAVREAVESTHGEAAVLTVAVDVASPSRRGLAEQVIDALSEAVTGTYPAWLPEAERLAGPGGAGLAAVRAMCERTAAGSDLFGPFLLAAAEASLCGRPLAVADFARETAVRQARKLILRAYGYERLVVMVELTGSWTTAQIEVAEAKKHPAGDRPLGGLFVMDEAQTFAPSSGRTATTDSTLALASQARKYGLGLVFATQAPKGLHNRIPGNATTQFYGLLNAPAQIAAAQEMAAQKGGDARGIARLRPGEFFVGSDLVPFQRVRSPMCLSHHPPSPMTQEEILELARAKRPGATPDAVQAVTAI